MNKIDKYYLIFQIELLIVLVLQRLLRVNYFSTKGTKVLHKVHKVPFIRLLILLFFLFFEPSLRTLWLIFNSTILIKFIFIKLLFLNLYNTQNVIEPLSFSSISLLLFSQCLHSLLPRRFFNWFFPIFYQFSSYFFFIYE